MAKRRRQLKAVQAAKARKRRRSRRRRRAVILAFEIIILMMLLGTAYVMAQYDKFQTVTIDAEDVEINEGAEKEGYTTIALFGGDSRDGQLEEGTHADTIIIVSIDNQSKEIRMASIYRDTLLQQMDREYNKANYAYFHGGPKEAINMLNKNLDLDIEDYVTVDFKALVDTIDLMGGLDIEIKEEEVDAVNEYMWETAEVAGTEPELLTHAGEQHLDGTQAVTYARIRSTAGGDYTRTERQRLVIEKLFEKVIHTNLGTINEIINTVFPQVSTSFTLNEILGLASGMTQYELAESAGFPFDKTDGITYQNAGSVVVPVGLVENVEQLHEFLYPEEERAGVSETIRMISQDISYITGVVRTSDYDEEQETSEEAENSQPEEDTSDIPVITERSQEDQE